MLWLNPRRAVERRDDGTDATADADVDGFGAARGVLRASRGEYDDAHGIEEIMVHDM